jgi:hypothetical protein
LTTAPDRGTHKQLRFENSLVSQKKCTLQSQSFTSTRSPSIFFKDFSKWEHRTLAGGGLVASSCCFFVCAAQGEIAITGNYYPLQVKPCGAKRVSKCTRSQTHPYGLHWSQYKLWALTSMYQPSPATLNHLVRMVETKVCIILTHVEINSWSPRSTRINVTILDGYIEVCCGLELGSQCSP